MINPKGEVRKHTHPNSADGCRTWTPAFSHGSPINQVRQARVCVCACTRVHIVWVCAHSVGVFVHTFAPVGVHMCLYLFVHVLCVLFICICFVSCISICVV